jgi:hypothetical protein
MKQKRQAIAETLASVGGHISGLREDVFDLIELGVQCLPVALAANEIASWLQAQLDHSGASAPRSAAQKIADQYGNDGQNWTDEDGGRHSDDCEERTIGDSR